MMTIQTVRYLMCDECLCSLDADGSLRGVDLRRYARTQGWRVETVRAENGGGWKRDLCPACHRDLDAPKPND